MKDKQLKAFISYSSKDKDAGAKIKRILDDFGMEGFLAHEDINVSEEWKQRIREELNKSDVFIPLLSKNFKESDWAPQELGIAYYRDILIIPLQLDDTIPFGFIDHLQGKRIKQDSDFLTYLIQPIVGRFPNRMIPAVIEKLERVGTFRYAESVMELLVPYFDKFEQKDIDRFVDVSIKNRQIWEASSCAAKDLPHFIKINGDKINPERREELLDKIKWVLQFL